MFSAEFAQEYSNLRAFKFRSENPLRKEVLDESNKWSEQLSEHLVSYLRGNPLSAEESNAFIDSYVLRMGGSFMKKAQRASASFDSDSSYAEIESFYEGVISQILSLYSSDIWRDVLTGNEPSTYTVNETQIKLASICLDFMEPLKTKHEAGELFKWNRWGKDSHYSIADRVDTGAMSLATEIDALVAMLEACKQQPGYIAVPAPHQFEHNVVMPDMNVDILEIDVAHNNIHGIQVKQSMRGASKDRKYDPRFVTMLDGEQDLKNVIYIRKPNSGSTAPVPMPGLYSAHFLANQRNLFRLGDDQKGNMAHGRLPHARMHVKLRAREFINIAPSANEYVNSRMSEIALRDLAVY